MQTEGAGAIFREAMLIKMVSSMLIPEIAQPNLPNNLFNLSCLFISRYSNLISGLAICKEVVDEVRVLMA